MCKNLYSHDPFPLLSAFINIMIVLPHDVFVMFSVMSLRFPAFVVHDGYGSDVVEKFTAWQYIQVVPSVSSTVAVTSSIIKEQ